MGSSTVLTTTETSPNYFNLINIEQLKSTRLKI